MPRHIPQRFGVGAPALPRTRDRAADSTSPEDRALIGYGYHLLFLMVALSVVPTAIGMLGLDLLSTLTSMALTGLLCFTAWRILRNMITIAQRE